VCVRVRVRVRVHVRVCVLSPLMSLKLALLGEYKCVYLLPTVLVVKGMQLVVYVHPHICVSIHMFPF